MLPYCDVQYLDHKVEEQYCHQSPKRNHLRSLH